MMYCVIAYASNSACNAVLIFTLRDHSWSLNGWTCILSVFQFTDDDVWRVIICRCVHTLIFTWGIPFAVETLSCPCRIKGIKKNWGSDNTTFPPIFLGKVKEFLLQSNTESESWFSSMITFMGQFVFSLILSWIQRQYIRDTWDESR